MAVIRRSGKAGKSPWSKAYAGQHVLMDELEPGVWLVKLGEFIPDDERWLHAPDVKADLGEPSPGRNRIGLKPISMRWQNACHEPFHERAGAGPARSQLQSGVSATAFRVTKASAARRAGDVAETGGFALVTGVPGCGTRKWELIHSRSGSDGRRLYSLPISQGFGQWPIAMKDGFACCRYIQTTIRPIGNGFGVVFGEREAFVCSITIVADGGVAAAVLERHRLRPGQKSEDYVGTITAYLQEKTGKAPQPREVVDTLNRLVVGIGQKGDYRTSLTIAEQTYRFAERSLARYCLP
ncbi:MAG: hypothetical protein R3F36_02455 [Candidatus Competibacteraceae bacterium]